MSRKPIGVLLAAGQSSRFGRNKLLYPLIGNIPMLLVCAEKLRTVLPDSVVVINGELISLRSQLEQLGLNVIVNEQAVQGMGSSIACAIRASEQAHPDAGGWLIMLADMPYIEIGTIEMLARQLEQGANIVAPQYRQQRGHPVGFSRRYKNELLELNLDTGARDILKNYHHELSLLPVDDEGILLDIDRPADIR